MNLAHWLARPFAVASLTLALTLVPVALAVRHFQRAAAASDAAIFSAASATVEEKLRLMTVRHTSWLNILRNRLGTAAGRTARDLDRELPDYIWRNSPPHWHSIALVEGGHIVWMRGQEIPPLAVGAEISAEPKIAALLAGMAAAPASEHQFPWSTALPGRRLCVAMQLRGDTSLLGWLDLAAMCASPEAQLSGKPGALLVALADEKRPDSRVVEIGENRLTWQAAIARGPRYAELLAHPSGTYALAAGGFTALLLATLAGLAAKARLDSQRTLALRAALDAEREVGRLRGQFVSSVSHEFRTPLSVIVSSADLLESYGPQLDAARSSEAVAQIQDSAARLAEMVDEILLLSRLESGRVQPRADDVDLSQLCHVVAREVATATRDRCPISVEASGSARSDATLLRSILANLLGNAVKYSPAGSPIRLAAEQRGGATVFTVSDRGIGIPAPDLARVGEAFHRAANVGDTPGTGLGLAIVRRSAALLGGTFSIESEEGRGTTATLTLPAA